MKEIGHIGFPSLTTLNACGNLVDSIEFLHRIFLPNLKEIWITQAGRLKDPNFIISLRSLKKGDWPHLITVAISKKLAMKTGIKFKRERTLVA